MDSFKFYFRTQHFNYVYFQWTMINLRPSTSDKIGRNIRCIFGATSERLAGGSAHRAQKCKYTQLYSIQSGE